MKSGPDQDKSKGALEPESLDEAGNESLKGQLPHRPETELINGNGNSNDTDFPEPGQSPEHTGEPEQDDVRKRKNKIA